MNKVADVRLEGFASPEQLPDSEGERAAWQEANRTFWESHPMRYDWNVPLGYEAGSRSYYEEIDRRFFASVLDFMPWKSTPFDNLIDFGGLAGKRVLEIGTGAGSHAALLSARALSYTGIDITAHAVDATAERLRLYGLKGSVVRMDAEKMSFPDESFDLVWSWGVIHHSADTRRILREIRRVLTPGGAAVIMVYHRGWWNYYTCGFLIHGLIQGRLFKTGSAHRAIQSVTDGAIARYYSARSWRKTVGDLFEVENVRVKGSKAEVFPIPAGRVKSLVMRAVPSALSRVLTNNCRMGSFLISRLTKRREPGPGSTEGPG